MRLAWGVKRRTFSAVLARPGGWNAQWIVHLLDEDGWSLVLQLYFSLTAVVSGCGFGLVLSSPKGPGHDKAGADRWPEQETGQKIAHLRHRRQERGQAHQAAAGAAGLLSFALPHVARRRSAANRA